MAVINGWINWGFHCRTKLTKSHSHPITQATWLLVWQIHNEFDMIYMVYTIRLYFCRWKLMTSRKWIYVTTLGSLVSHVWEQVPPCLLNHSPADPPHNSISTLGTFGPCVCLRTSLPPCQAAPTKCGSCWKKSSSACGTAGNAAWIKGDCSMAGMATEGFEGWSVVDGSPSGETQGGNGHVRAQGDEICSLQIIEVETARTFSFLEGRESGEIFFFLGGEGAGRAIRCLVMMDSDNIMFVATFHVDSLATALKKEDKKLSLNSQWHSLNDWLEWHHVGPHEDKQKSANNESLCNEILAPEPSTLKGITVSCQWVAGTGRKTT